MKRIIQRVLFVLLFSVVVSALAGDLVEHKAHVGFLVVATGKYIRYIEALFKSAEQYFLPGHPRTFFVFTDHIDEAPKGPNIIPVYQKDLVGHMIR